VNQDVLLLLATASAAAIAAHALTRHFVLACLVTAIASMAVIVVVVFVRERFHVGVVANAPFMMGTVGLPSAVISAVVGVPFVLARRRRDRREGTPPVNY
jgi:hypothetical protein